MKRFISSFISFMSGTVMYVVAALLTAAPLFMLGFPWWVDFLIIIGIYFIPFFGGLAQIVIWIWGLVAAISGPQDILAIIYYVLFAVYAVLFLVPIVLSTIQTIIKKSRGY